jgi:SAM-dependent methyltransferase
MAPPAKKRGFPLLLTFLVLVVILCIFQIGMLMFPKSELIQTASSQLLAIAPIAQKNHQNIAWDPKVNPLAIPPGQAKNLPSVRVEEDNIDRKIYGGAGDKGHLGGFTTYDGAGVSPLLWTTMIQEFGVKSLLDVGCGRGISSRWFLEHGVDVLCVEGSHDAVEQSFLPAERIVEHDFSRGPWWPEKTYDALWSVEVLEHISRQYHFEFFTAFRKAALIFVTSSTWGGWHHVEVHPDEWWIRKLESYGFRYDASLTMQARATFAKERQMKNMTGPDGRHFNADHLKTVKVFINPAVAALPEHAHLFPRPGCFQRYAKQGEPFAVTRPCGKKEETPLPASFEPLQITRDMHQRWNDLIQKDIEASATKSKSVVAV